MSLVDADKQWFKSRCGFETQETSMDVYFCAHAIASSEPLIVEDALLDERFKSNPLVVEEPKICLYAGFPLQTTNDQRIGTLCVIDRKPRYLSKITDIRFSHGICDSCLEKHFPDVLEVLSDEQFNLNNQRNSPEGKKSK